MGMETQTRFRVDKSKCIKCGKCLNTCSGLVLKFGADGYPEMIPFERFGWRGCWRCQHCLAVCPKGAISIFGKRPEDSLPPVPIGMGRYMESLVTNRRSCRRFLAKNVKPEIISSILKAMEAAPTGGNAMGVEYTVIDDIDRVDEIWQEAYAVMEEKAAKHIYTHSFSDFYYKKMKESEKSLRKDDLLFCGAPHLFIAHEKCVGKWAEDSKANCHIATAYFELLCNAHGLGTTIMSYSAEALPLYKRVYEAVKGKPHFVITTNVDGQFYKAGFDPGKVFCVQGDYAFIQCTTACHRKLYPDHDIVKEMVLKQSDCKVPSGLVPYCPVCGGPMDINLRKDEFFIQDERWDLQNQRYMEFLQEARDRKLVLLEYGVGFNTPTIIRLPFERMAATFPDTTLIRINKDHRGLYFSGVKKYIPLSAWLTESQG